MRERASKERALSVLLSSVMQPMNILVIHVNIDKTVQTKRTASKEKTGIRRTVKHLNVY